MVVDDEVLCHGCGAIDPNLTFEHAPPYRVQLLMDEKRYKLTNAIDYRSAEIKRTEKARKPNALPFAKKHPRGLGATALCQNCQQLTQTYYGQQFYDFAVQAKALALVTDPDAGSVSFKARFHPLPVIKQVITSLLTISDFVSNRDFIKLRRLIQDVRLAGSILPFQIFAYLNPPNNETKNIAQSRQNTTQIMIDAVSGSHDPTFCVAELSYPPVGFLLIDLEFGTRLAPVVSSLTNISTWSEFEFDRQVDLDLKVAVRTPFGPFSPRYWQDAKAEPKSAQLDIANSW